MKKDSNKKLAFTLAEVLITLGIIGIVSAMTIPTLVTRYQKNVTLSKLKKVYAEFGSIAKMSIINGNIYNHNMSSNTVFDTFIKPHVRSAKMINESEAFKFNQLNGAENVLFFSTDEDFLSFTTDNGIKYSIYRVGEGTDGTRNDVWFDLNGSSAPNILGKDIFVFHIDFYNGTVAPFRLESVTYGGPGILASDCSTSGSGRYCFTKIYYDGWQIKDDYPW